MELWELIARERVRDVYTDYTHAGDRMRLIDLAECFTVDGELAVEGQFTAIGRDAIVDRLSAPAVREQDSSAAPFFVRHFITNLRFASVSENEIRTTAYFAVFTPDGPDHWGRYRDVLVPVADRWLFRSRSVTVDAAASGSRFDFQ